MSVSLVKGFRVCHPQGTALAPVGKDKGLGAWGIGLGPGFRAPVPEECSLVTWPGRVGLDVWILVHAPVP